MHTTVEITQLLHVAFPLVPVPAQIFLPASSSDEIVREIAPVFSGRRWDQITAQGWRDAGNFVLLSSYMTPAAVAYYVPSLLCEAAQTNDFSEAIHVLLPPNKRREPRGAWWNDYVAAFTDSQREAIKQFLHYAMQCVPEASFEAMYMPEALRLICKEA